jgi:ketosteroid isomerase-like protein
MMNLASWAVVAAITLPALDTPVALPAQGKTNQVLDRVTSELAAAFNAEDAARAALLYTEDAVLMPANMPMIKGRAAIEGHFKKEFAAADMTLLLKPIESTIDGSQGFAIGTSAFSPRRSGASQTAAGLPMGQTGKYVLVFKRVGADWKIAYDIFNDDAPAPSTK